MIELKKNTAFDLITMGRVGVDLYAEQINSPLREVQSFKKSLGGSPANVAVGVARLGLKSALFSAVGSDELGSFLKGYLVKENVSTHLINTLSDKLTAMVVLGIQPPSQFPLIFYRQDCADMNLSEKAIQRPDFMQTKVFLFTGTGLSTELLRKTTQVALSYCLEEHVIRILDLDYRPVLWGLTNKGDGETRFKQCEQVTKYYQTFISSCDLIVGTEEELCIAGGHRSVEDSIYKLKSISSAIIVYKRGLKGSTVYFPDGTEQTVATFPVEIYNTLGAGDAYLSGLISALIRGMSWQSSLQWANAAGAIVCSRHGCAPAMPTLDEIQYFLNHYPQKQQRIVFDKQLNRLHLKHIVGKASTIPSCFLAYDHRWQFEQSCQEHGANNNLISHFKSLVYRGFLKMNRPNDAQHHKAIICDPGYGKEVLNQAGRDGYCIFVPIEAANQVQLQWIEPNISVHEILLKRPASWGVKVLWVFHPDLPESTKLWQLTRLRELASACDSLERKLMLELILPESIAVTAENISQCIQEVYSQEIFPFWWKLQAVDSPQGWKVIDSIISQYDKDARIILLGGKNKSMDLMRQTFRTALSSQLMNGFAIGRNLFWPVWEKFIRGQLTDEDVVHQIEVRYDNLFKEWECCYGAIKESINSCE